MTMIPRNHNNNNNNGNNNNTSHSTFRLCLFCALMVTMFHFHSSWFLLQNNNHYNNGALEQRILWEQLEPPPMSTKTSFDSLSSSSSSGVVIHETKDNDNDNDDDNVDDSDNDHHSNHNNHDIRSWGCHLTQTPFIFVHIPKAGGGSIRRRIAGSAYNYTRSPQSWSSPDQDASYYRIRTRRKNSNQEPNDENNDNDEIMEQHATFCNSGHAQYMPIVRHKSFEGTRACTASTPIGQALACPEYMNPNSQTKHCQGGGGREGVGNEKSTANMVYVGHNGFGSELHWLHSELFQQWWQQEWMKRSNDDHDNAGNFLAEQWKRLDGTHVWCGNYTLPGPVNSSSSYHKKQPRRQKQLQSRLDDCVQSEQLVECMDHAALAWAAAAGTRKEKDDVDHSDDDPRDDDPETAITTTKTKQSRPRPPSSNGRLWSAVYASLPVLRVVMIRNPFDFFASHYSWLSLRSKGIVCDDVSMATAGAGNANIYQWVEHETEQRKQQQAQSRQQQQQQIQSQTQTPRNNKQQPTRQAQSKPNNNNRNHKKTTRKDHFYLHGSRAHGWVTRLALDYIYLLCGDDCRVRHWTKKATLEDIVTQAEFNLRHAFAVVGILGSHHHKNNANANTNTSHNNNNNNNNDDDPQETFFEMIATRVEYMENITNPDHNPFVPRRTAVDPKSATATTTTTTASKRRHLHSTQGLDQYCKDKFRQPSFQQALQDVSPEIAAMAHLYHVAVQVNQFQQAELQHCRRAR